MTNEDFSEYLYYDVTSPSCLRWAIDRFAGNAGQICKARKGDVAGWKTVKGYWDVMLNSKTYKAHRVIVQLHGICCEGKQVDHINGDRADNRVENLRVVNGATNQRNRTMNKNNSTGVSGVSVQVYKGHPRYYKAYWMDLSRNLVVKCFSIAELGVDLAFSSAVEARASALRQMNDVGAGYLENHGKPR